MNLPKIRLSSLRRPRHVATALFLVTLCAVSPGRAHAVGLTITPTFDSTITSDPNAAAIESTINQAINTYESSFSDPINVLISFQAMTSGLGQSNTVLYKISYQQFSTRLTADATTADDNTALALLPIGASNPVTGSTQINVKTANLRAIGINGLPSGLPGGVDGIVGLNTHITDIGSPGTTGQYSLLAVVEHEINEVLGLGSDLPGGGFFSDPAPEDLFRFLASGTRSFTTNTSTHAFFSINGTTDLAQFDNQNDGGDFGDWQSNPLPAGTLPKVQDAFATPGAHPTLGVELRALDVIGYNLVPEPASVTLLCLGMAFLVCCNRRRFPLS